MQLIVTVVGGGNACSADIATCSVTMSEQSTVTAIFSAVPGGAVHPLSVVVRGSGTVTSHPSGAACGRTCSADVAADGADQRNTFRCAQ